MLSPRRIVGLFPSIAGVLGAAGVAVSAAAAHVEGGGPATTAGLFLLLHAAALLGLPGVYAQRPTGWVAVAGSVLLAGTILFCGELSLGSLVGIRPLPWAAPFGGLLMIAGWLLIPLGTLVDRIVRRQAGP